MLENRIIRLPEVIKMVGLSQTTIWRLQQENTFPKSVKISSRACGWSLNEINQWINARLKRKK